MVNVVSKRCLHLGCDSQPSFNQPGGKGLYCSSHKLEGMIDVKSKRCENVECNLLNPLFDLPGGKGRFCKIHHMEGMIDVKHTGCAYQGCATRPSFDKLGGKGLYCTLHKLEGMVDVVSKRCAYQGCETCPSFNKPGGKGVYCTLHKQEGMIDVVSKRCANPGCETKPTFGLQGGKPQYCIIHKNIDMIDVLNKKCAHKGCDSNPTFGLPGEKRQYCVAHKTNNMCDVMSKKCINKGCDRCPVFGLLGEKPLYCSSHKNSEMVDVKHKHCACGTRAKFGIPAKEPTACAQHKEIGMISEPRKRCSMCKNTGTHEKDKHRFCETHAPANSTNLAIKECTSCHLPDILTNGLCPTCDPVTIAKAKHEKELAVKAVLDINNLKYESHDRMVDKGECFKYRPDFVFDAGTHIVVLEVDENQHKSYACDCEQQRMVNISQSFGMPTMFIRYNPDAFTGPHGKPSRISKTQREKHLTDWVTWALTPEYSPSATGAFCCAVHLFYDGFTQSGEAVRVKLL
jgi:hypothetical protein